MRGRSLLLVALALASCGRVPVPHHVDPAAVQRVATQPAANPGYHHGPVMHDPVVHTVFWLPAGHHFEPVGTGAGDAAYEQRVNRFL
ncbi:MAG: hypothetical protein E6J41_16495, partial [Chloroflexi bacterium]